MQCYHPEVKKSHLSKRPIEKEKKAKIMNSVTLTLSQSMNGDGIE